MLLVFDGEEHAKFRISNISREEEQIQVILIEKFHLSGIKHLYNDFKAILVKILMILINIIHVLIYH